mmetsp:Transcript_47867/g.78843  ORF Transcript_47867/g.78843 Transcript_47867/m.78843 type:complete len:377 (-) Transcript_47867:1417-2547(-)
MCFFRFNDCWTSGWWFRACTNLTTSSQLPSTSRIASVLMLVLEVSSLLSGASSSKPVTLTRPNELDMSREPRPNERLLTEFPREAGFSESFANKPPCCWSSSGGPCSTIDPFWKTITRSTFAMAPNRCAMLTTVRPAIASDNAATTADSQVLSSAEVNSSNNNIEGFLTTARAMLMRCFCPPLRLTLPWPNLVCNPAGNAMMKSKALATLAAAITSSCVAFGLPNLMFSSTVMSKSTVSCSTTPTWPRSQRMSYCSIGTSSSKIWPFVGAYKRCSKHMTVLLPDPLCPTNATVSPALMVKLTPFSTLISGRAGYAKCTSRNSIFPLNKCGMRPPSFSILGFVSSIWTSVAVLAAYGFNHMKSMFCQSLQSKKVCAR